MKIPFSTLDNPRFWAFAAGINAVIFFWAVAAAMHYQDCSLGQIKLKYWLLICFGCAPPNVIVGGPMRIFQLDVGRYFLLFARFWAIAAAVVFLILSQKS